MVKFDNAQLSLLRSFVELCKSNVDIIHQPELQFFADWLLSLGANLPKIVPMPAHDDDEEKCEPSIPPLDLEDLGGLIDPDTDDESLSMGPSDMEDVSDESIEKSDELRREAQEKLAADDVDAAIGLFTEAIDLNPHSAVLFAKRASALLKTGRPNAAIRDCTRALELNENSVQALKWRGRAHRLLGDWAKAYTDFCQAQKIDFDEDVSEWIKEVKPNALKITEHARQMERLAEERADQERNERVKRAAQQEHEKPKSEQHSVQSTDVSLADEDWDKIIQVCELVNSVPDGPSAAIRTITRRLGPIADSLPSCHELLLTTSVLEALVKNCGRRFHKQLTWRPFMKLVRSIIDSSSSTSIFSTASPLPYPLLVQERVKSMIQSWALVFHLEPDLKPLCDLYLELKEKIDFPPEDLSSSPISTNPTQDCGTTVPDDQPNTLASTARNVFSSIKQKASNAFGVLSSVNDSNASSSGQQQNKSIYHPALEKIRSELSVVQQTIYHRLLKPDSHKTSIKKFFALARI